MSKQNLLIVDDDELISLTLIKSFSDQFNLKVAHSAKAAVDLLISFKPDIIILDYMMPAIKGDELYGYLKDIYTDSKFIVLSSNENTKVFANFVKIGIRHYVIKDENMIAELKNVFKELEEESN